MEFQLPIRVYIEDTDAGGIVYHVNYLKYMERSRTELIRQLGFGKAALGGGNTAVFVVSEAKLKYHRSAQLDDEIVSRAKLISLRKASLVFEQGVWRGDQLLCGGDIKVACVQRDTLKATRIPKELYRALEEVYTPA